MNDLSRRGFIRLAGLSVVSVAGMGLAGCGSTSGGSTDSNSSSSGEKYGKGFVLRYGTDCDYPPYDWVQSDDSNGAVPIQDGSGYCNGYDTKIAKLIADKYGWTVEVVKVDFDGLIEALKAGKCDCVIDGMGVTEERKKSVDFSHYYWTSSQGILCLKTSKCVKATSLEDLSGAKVVAQLGSMWESMVDQIPGVDKQDAIADEATILAALQAGKVDATIMGETEAKSAIKTNPDLTFVSFEDGKGFTVDESDCSAGIAVAKGNTELLDKINAVVDTLTDEKKEDLMNEAFDQQPASTVAAG